MRKEHRPLNTPTLTLAAIGTTFGVALVASLLIWSTTPASAANEVYSSGIRCNNKPIGARTASEDKYVYFGSNSSKVRAEDLPKIKHIYGIAKGQSVQQICLFGKASKNGDASSNNALGEKRARNVAREFEKLGWPRSKIVIGTEGEAWGWLQEMLTSDALEDRRVLIRLSQ